MSDNQTDQTAIVKVRDLNLGDIFAWHGDPHRVYSVGYNSWPKWCENLNSRRHLMFEEPDGESEVDLYEDPKLKNVKTTKGR